jgi:hypothetical protein
MKIAFHSDTLGLRGSDQAVWDYANFNESILGNRSVICFQDRIEIDQNPSFTKWKSRFPLVVYANLRELEKKLKNEQADVLYMIKPGPYDGRVVQGIKICIHAMFLNDEFLGDEFAFVSGWASEVMTGTRKAFVPHFVPTHQKKEDFRIELGIPREARVFGRHGASDTFNIPMVHSVVAAHARKNPNDHFVFLNTEVVAGTEKLRNVHYLPVTADPNFKGRFLATCNAMLHARWHGETFGLAVGEFAVLGKPVITFGGSRERAHLDMLGAQAQIYMSEKELQGILETFEPRPTWGTAYEAWADPQAVMKIFQQRFLGGSS